MALKVGDRILFDGVPCRVERVAPGCAAYIRSERRRSVTLTDPATGDERTFEARKGGLIAVSLNAGPVLSREGR